MLFLNKNDILKAANYKKIVKSIEHSFLSCRNKNFYMPDRVHLEFKNNTLLIMPSFTENIFGTKLVSLFPDNPRKGEPVLQGIMVLNEGDTGKPLALMDAATLTALRTGAVGGGVGVKYITDEKINSLGIIGLGIQGYYQSLFATDVRNINRMFIYDINFSKTEKFMEKFAQKKPKIKIIKAKNSEQVIINSQVIITATSSYSPVLPDKSDIYKGKSFIGIGSYKPDMREYPDSFFKHVGRIYVDTEFAVEETGDLITPLKKGWINKSQIYSLAKLVKEKKSDCPPKNSVLMFKSVGMALFDLFIGFLIYRESLSKKIGLSLDL